MEDFVRKTKGVRDITSLPLDTSHELDIVSDVKGKIYIKILNRYKELLFDNGTEQWVIDMLNNLEVDVEQLKEDILDLEQTLSEIPIIEDKLETVETKLAQINTLFAQMQIDVQGLDLRTAELEREVVQLALKDQELLDKINNFILNFDDKLYDLGFTYIKWYNPKGDGVTDDSEVFQRAINDADVLILEKEKVYRVKNLIIDKPNGLSIDGRNSTLKGVTENDSIYIIEPTSKNIEIFNHNFLGLADGTLDTVGGIIGKPKDNLGGKNRSIVNLRIHDNTFMGGFVFSMALTGVTNLDIYNNNHLGNNKYVAAKSAGGYFILVQSCYNVNIYENKATAMFSDRHAVYLSVDQSFVSNQRNENVSIFRNNFDWDGVGAKTGFESCMTSRSTTNLHIYDNIIRGGYGGIGMTPSNGHFDNVWIHDNTVYGQVAPKEYSRFMIGMSTSDKAEKFKIRTIKVTNNSLINSNPSVVGLNINEVENDVFSGNTITCFGGREANTIEVFNSENITIIDNSLKSNPNNKSRSAIQLNGNTKDVKIGYNQNKDFIFNFSQLNSDNEPVTFITPLSMFFGNKAGVTSEIYVLDSYFKMYSTYITQEDGFFLKLEPYIDIDKITLSTTVSDYKIFIAEKNKEENYIHIKLRDNNNQPVDFKTSIYEFNVSLLV